MEKAKARTEAKVASEDSSNADEGYDTTGRDSSELPEAGEERPAKRAQHDEVKDEGATKPKPEPKDWGEWTYGVLRCFDV
jgi:hypothetical protein